MAAEVLAGPNTTVTVYERMPSPARKLLMAGRGGLNLTHSEPLEIFLGRYAPRDASGQPVREAVTNYPPETVVAWANGLGQPTFIGSSGRIFPKAMKASPLLRAWLRRLSAQGVRLATGHNWTGWTSDGGLAFSTIEGEAVVHPDATLLALGGASWPRLGSNGSWLGLLATRGIDTRTFAPSNCGVDIAWSEMFRGRFEGEPLKRISISCGETKVRGEALITRRGLEGGAVYALSEAIRREMAQQAGRATLRIDLRPDLTLSDLAAKLAAPRQKQSTSTFLRKAIGLPPHAIALLRETGDVFPAQPYGMADLIKAVPVTVEALAGLDRAISSVGGVALGAMDDTFMLRDLPGVFVAGEMIDWDAPTGGYLLQATFATAVAAARGLETWLERG